MCREVGKIWPSPRTVKTMWFTFIEVHGDGMLVDGERLSHKVASHQRASFRINENTKFNFSLAPPTRQLGDISSYVHGMTIYAAVCTARVMYCTPITYTCMHKTATIQYKDAITTSAIRYVYPQDCQLQYGPAATAPRAPDKCSRKEMLPECHTPANTPHSDLNFVCP